MYQKYLFEIFLFQVGVHFFYKVSFLKAITEIDFLPNYVLTDDSAQHEAFRTNVNLRARKMF
jgi:hypothetical protein